MGTLSSGFPARGIARTSVGWSVALSLLLMLLGLIALTIPFFAGVIVETVIAWVLLFGGFAHLVLAFHVRGAGAHIWEALVGVAYLVAAAFLLLHPVAGLISLTLFLGSYLAVKGIFELIAGFTVRGVAGGGWLFVDGVISLVLAAFIWLHLPNAATWVVGTMLGVGVLFSGISRLALSLAARRTHAALL